MGKKGRRLTSLVLLVVMLLPMVVEARGIRISAWGAIAIDADTGEVLYSKNPDKALVPASITKVMTTYIIYEEMAAGRLNKNSLIKVSDRVARISRDRSYPMAVPLKAGGSYTVDQFIKLIMIPSASASCIAVAEHISGSEANFVKRMNATAKRMGIQANFKNSHGAKPHYTTARSMAVLIKNFIDDYPDILNYTSLQGINFNGKRYNILNKLMHSKRYLGVDGFKTGTIPEARYCLSATGKKDGRRVISVVLGSSSDNARYSDSKKILDLAFAEQKARDLSRSRTNLNLVNLPTEIRRNAEYTPSIKFTNVGKNYIQDGKFYIDGKLVKSLNKVNIKNGKEIKIPFVYNSNDINKTSVELKYIMNLPNKKTKTVSKSIKLSKRVPAIYKDLANISHEKELRLKKLNREGLMLGQGNGYFGPNRITNRGEFITLLGRLVEYTDLDRIDNKSSSYKDVKTSDYYNKYVAWASENGLVEGYNNKFMPKKNVNIEEAALILDRFFDLYNIEVAEREVAGNIDRNNLSDWAVGAVESLSNLDILYKDGSNTLYPKESIKRIDLSDVVWKLWESIENEINMDGINDDQYLDESYGPDAIYKDIAYLDKQTKSIIEELKDNGIMQGKENGYFGPRDLTNRGDFITLLGRLAEDMDLDKIDNKPSVYKDVKTSDYYNKYVVWATDNELVKGYEGNKFIPKKNISVGEAAVIIDGFLDLYNIKLKDVRENGNIDRNLDGWAKESVIKLSKTNILYKFGSDKIYPAENIKRSDLAHMIWNIWKGILDKDELEEELKNIDEFKEEIKPVDEVKEEIGDIEEKEFDVEIEDMSNDDEDIMLDEAI